MKPIVGVLLVNLGTPNSPHPRDVYRYLVEFLTDKRVIDLPWLQRQLLVRGTIVPRRYMSSAKAYQTIWTPEGSPLLVNSQRLKQALQKSLGENYSVELGMRYQNPPLEKAIKSLINKNLSKLIILPLFPQYASATTGSVHEKVMNILSRQQTIPKVTFIDQFYNDQGMINAFASEAKKHPLEEYDRILFSFHGLPVKQLKAADVRNVCKSVPNCCEQPRMDPLNNPNCYAAQCYATGRAIADQLKLSADRYTICFQSRLGKEPWLEPYTSQEILKCAQRQEKKLLVFSPSFICDCLETIYEIEIEYAAEFKAAGGSQLTLVKSLNDQPIWIEALKKMICTA